MDFLTYYNLSNLAACVAILAALHFLSRGFSQKEPAGISSRIGSVDFLKGMAILGVVYLHASSYFPQLFDYGPIFWFPVPCFILASGYLLSRKYNAEPEKAYTGLLRRIIIPYLVLVLLGVLLISAVLFSDPANLASDIILGRLNGGNLYFVPVIAQLYLLFPLLSKLQKKIPPLAFLSSALLVSFISKAYDDSVQLLSWNQDPFSAAFCGRFLFFFAVGMYLSRADMGKGFQKRIAPAVAALAVLVYVTHSTEYHFIWLFFYPLVAAAICVMLYSLARKSGLPSKISKAVNAFGEASFFIYVTHPPLLAALLPALAWLGVYSVIPAIPICAAAGVLAYRAYFKKPLVAAASTSG